jgi:hypothetical protein
MFRKVDTTPCMDGWSSYDPKMAASSGSASKAARMRVNTSGCTATSESMKIRIEPLARVVPAFRAAAGPMPGGPSTTITSVGASVAA